MLILKNLAILIGVIIIIGEIGILISPKWGKKKIRKSANNKTTVNLYSNIILIAGIAFTWLALQEISIMKMLLSFIVLGMIVWGFLVWVFPDLPNYLAKQMVKKSNKTLRLLSALDILVALILITWGLS